MFIVHGEKSRAGILANRFAIGAQSASMSLVRGKVGRLPREVTRLSAEFKQLKGEDLYFWVQNKSIGRDLYRAILSERNELAGRKEINILLDSPGGDVHSAYKIFQLFRRYAGRVRVYVISYAKSAATFVCLAADEFVMGENAELGPMDMQVPDPRHPRRSVSALDGFKMVEYLREYALETLDYASIVLKRRLQFRDMEDVLPHSIPFVQGITTPLYGQVEPLDLGEYGRILGIVKDYGIRVMGRAERFRGLTQKEIENLLDRIISSYPSHGFVIDFEEAVDAGLAPRKLETDEEKLFDPITDWIESTDEECVGIIPAPSPLQAITATVKVDVTAPPPTQNN